MRLDGIDDGKAFDWGRASEAYARFRPGYPEDFYELLASLGVGLPGQRMLDLGTGTGVLAIVFARRGAHVTGVDISDRQVAVARDVARREGLDIAFEVSRVEDVDFPASSFDVVSAGQSWLYFDAQVMVAKVLGYLTREGALVLTHLLWLPHKDPIARASEELVLRHNPHWSAGGYEGTLSPMPAWAAADFDLEAFEVIERPLPFTRETWRGRFRACRGVGASLTADQISTFDTEHDELLRRIAGDQFEVWHQMTVHVFRRKGAASPHVA